MDNTNRIHGSSKHKQFVARVFTGEINASICCCFFYEIVSCLYLPLFNNHRGAWPISAQADTESG